MAFAAGAASAETLLPKFDPDKFVEGQEVDSKYFPLEAGRRAVLRAKGVEDGERFTEKSVLTVLDRPGPRILGVRTTTQFDKAYEDGLLVETFDYFAQDKPGNVWYIGKDVTNFHYDDKGNLIRKDHESAWRAGRRGGKPGYMMPARQIVGQRYFRNTLAAIRRSTRARPSASSTGCVSAAPYTATCCGCSRPTRRAAVPRDQVLCAPGRPDPGRRGGEPAAAEPQPDLGASMTAAATGPSAPTPAATGPPAPTTAGTASATAGAPGAGGADATGRARRRAGGASDRRHQARNREGR